MTTAPHDPYHHLHDEAYADVYAAGRVGAHDMVAMAGRQVQSLNGTWSFVLDLFDEGLRQRWFADVPCPAHAWTAPRDYDGGDWQPITTPSCWNLLKPEWFFFEGSAWYARTLQIDAIAPGERLKLRIGAANYEARVFLNGRFTGSHRGGSTPFFIDITDTAHPGNNRLMIQVDNRRRSDAVPMHHIDWFNYGGLYRDVALVRVPAVFIRDFAVTLVPGSDGRHIRADATLSAAVDGDGALSIPGLGGPWPMAFKAGRGTVELDARPELWSPAQPTLYDVAISFEADRVSDRIGFRSVAVAGERILLNGREIFLRGICVHEDDIATGKASSDHDIRRRFADAKALGCNFMRLAHYPHHERAAAIADEVGMLLWAEIPVYWAIDFSNPDTLADAENQLSELIRRDRNRASVIIWGVGNENADTDARLAFMGHLAAVAKREDPSRLVSAACLINRQTFAIEDRLAEHLDIIGINEYFGWYEPDFDGLRRLLANSTPGKPVIITETGADAVAGMFSTDGGLFSEERQAAVYREQLTILATAGYIRGICPWILYDFRSERRQTAFQRGWNRKGLIAGDKTTRKLAFHVLAAHYHNRMADQSSDSP